VLQSFKLTKRSPTPVTSALTFCFLQFILLESSKRLNVKMLEKHGGSAVSAQLAPSNASKGTPNGDL